MVNVEVRGLRFFGDDDGRRPFRSLCFTDLYLPDLEITLREVLLTWEAKKGYRIMPPFALAHGGVRAVQWRYEGEFAQAAMAKVCSAFEAMGGTLPDAANDNDDYGVRRVLGDKS